MRKLKAKETAHEPNQFTRVTKLPPVPFIFMGNICTQSDQTCQCYTQFLCSYGTSRNRRWRNVGISCLSIVTLPLTLWPKELPPFLVNSSQCRPVSVTKGFNMNRASHKFQVNRTKRSIFLGCTSMPVSAIVGTCFKNSPWIYMQRNALRWIFHKKKGYKY